MLYVFGDYALDTQLYELRHTGQPCKLEPQVFNVLAYLIQHRDRVADRKFKRPFGAAGAPPQHPPPAACRAPSVPRQPAGAARR